tara:strand:- start:2 stop:598 length:597 start_codon:yes stop_codon:yes gene_type:complete
MTLMIFAVVILGILFGYAFIPPEFLASMDQISTLLLGLLIFSVGIDIGGNKGALKDIKSKSKMLGGLTSAVIIGSAIGGLITGLIFRHPANTSLAISAGYGWYSLSGILLKNMASAEIGAIAFMSNVFREMMAFVLIPILALRVNHLTSIAPPGATSMDTTLPIISRATTPDIAVVAFLNGLILSTLVPILVPFFYAL